MTRAFHIFIFTAFLFISFITTDTFKAGQIKYQRVKTAYNEKEKSLKELYRSKNIEFSTQQIYLRAFKEEQELELWARSNSSNKFTLIKTYPVCASSGTLGPKRKKGDGQTPEGFYFIDRFNPQSSFYLSLGINYPNTSDKILGNQNPGGDIFIHGSCVTIGCLPLTDDLIKEVYLISIEAKNNRQAKIPVHIFPFRMQEEKINQKKDQTRYKTLMPFWNNLKPGYDYFEKYKTLQKISVASDGKYLFN